MTATLRGDARDHAEVMRDQHHGDAQLGLQIGQQPQDLRLDRDVQRRAGFVGDAAVPARTSAPWRSSPADRRPPESWCGYCRQALARRGDADLAPAARRRGRGGLGAARAACAGR